MNTISLFNVSKRQFCLAFNLCLQIINCKYILVQQLNEKKLPFEELHKMYAKNICGTINVIVNNEAIAQELCGTFF